LGKHTWNSTTALLAALVIVLLGGCSGQGALPDATVAPTVTTMTVPTENPEDPDLKIVSAQLTEWFDDNGGCELPCWWGIEPGVTTWMEIEETFKPYAAEVFQTGREKRLVFNVSDEINPYGSFDLTLVFDKQWVVQEIIPGSWTLEPEQYSLPYVLAQFGEPDQIWVIAAVQYIQSFSLTLFYESEGLYFLYTGEGIPESEETMLLCPANIQQDESPLIHLWKPGLYQSLTALYPSYQDMYQLKDITDWNTSRFYQTFDQSEDDGTCIEISTAYAVDG
jgi:hypothetical protein